MITTVDIVLLTLVQERLHVVLLKRDQEPFKDALALPGGYIHPEEDADSGAAARRVLQHKTRLVSPYLEQLYTFSSAARDPRGWSISVAYYALVNIRDLLTKGASCEILPVDELPQLSFDHNKIIECAVQRVRSKSTYSTLPCYLLPEQFTLGELQKTYEMVLGAPLNKASFRRKVSSWDFIEEVPGALRTTKGNSAQLYVIKDEGSLEFFSRTVREG